MIDLSLLRKNTEEIKNLILKKEPGFDVDSLISMDNQVRSLIKEIEDLRKEKNEISKNFSGGSISEEIKQKSIAIGKDLKTKEKELSNLESDFKNLALSCPNLLQEIVPEGDKSKNQVVETVGEKPVFSFKPKNHVELNEENNWFDMQSASYMSGSNFVVYKGIGLKILYALTNLMIKNNVKYGFEPVLPPYLVNEQALFNSGNLPKFAGDFYSITEDGLCLIPTAEVSLTNIHANTIFDGKDLPKRYTSWTSCFRREAGSYGSEERGLIRIHQFEKVELYSITKSEDSNEELDKMIACSQDILKQLGLHYRISLLAAQDCSFSSSKTYDIEVWLPGQDRFYEVSSCSNCTDFQARRAKIRYRKDSSSKPELVHTLNGSSLALPRLMVAIMEQYQKEDGSIELPNFLEKAAGDIW